MAPEQWAGQERRWDFFSTGFRHELSPRHLFGQDGVDFQERVSFARLREYRLGRLRQAMARHGLAALLLNLGDSIRYATGVWDYAWKGNTGTQYALVFHDRPPTLFEAVGPDTQAVQLHCPWMRDRIAPAIAYRHAGEGFEAACRRYWDQVAGVCREHGADVRRDRLGVDAQDLAGYDVGKAAGLLLVPAGRVLHEARRVKSPDELELLKIAAAIGDMAYWRAKHEFARPGVREREILGKVVDFMYQCGAQHCWGTNVASGGNTNPYIRAFTDKLIRQGDMLILDLNSNSVYGYAQDTCRSWVVAAPMTRRQREVYRLCYERLQAALARVRAGASTREIAEAFPPYYDDTYKTCSMVQFAHAIGQTLSEGVSITRGFSLDSPQVLEENMVLAVETWAGDPGDDFSVRLEDDVVVTETGYVATSLFPFEAEAVGDLL
ncbi:MAG TPA: Xaa-Pro peptidase family protein [Candidatus Methylomirabilis sp.]|jgi:Xaa-Pro dipeptidase